MRKKRVNWNYQGDTGPEYWHKLCPDCAICGNGTSQSPVDISGAVKAGTGDIVFDYMQKPLFIRDNGFNIEFRSEDFGSVVLEDRTYFLDHFHFHSPSEHTFAGSALEMEVHLVHKDARENLAVVGVLFRQGKYNPLIQSLWDLVSRQEKDDSEQQLIVDVLKLLPEKKDYYYLEGSLTTPPCTEGVKWVVMKTTLEVSDAQIQWFLSLTGPNARPVQPLNGRAIYEYQ